MPGERPRILYLVGQLSIGGAELQLIQLVKHLDRTRFEPIVCALSEQVPLAPQLRDAGIELVVLPRRMDPDLTRLWRLPRVVRRYRPALIHSYLFVANAWARLVGTVLGVPVIISERSAAVDKSRGRLIIDRLLARAAIFMIANSQAGAELAIARHEIASHKVAVVHNGIALEGFDSAQPVGAARTALGLAPTEPVVGIVGRLSQVKNHRTFFHAMAKIAAEVPSLRLLCVGEGPLRAELEALVSTLALQDRTVFTGLRSDIPDLMRTMNVIALTSTWEGLPNVLIEAMAASRPVVATHVGGVPEVVVHDETGLLVPPGDPSALAAAVLSLLKNPTLATEMGRKGRARVEQQFSIKRMVAETEAIYDHLLDKAGVAHGR